MLVRCGLFAAPEPCSEFDPTPPDLELVGAIDAGHIRYDPRAAHGCLEEITWASCDQTHATVRRQPSCDAVYVGQLEAGAACTRDEECASAACDAPACDDGCCIGSCLPRISDAEIGATCRTSSDCRDGFCNELKFCAPLVEEGHPCREDDECVLGLACVGAGIDPGRCRPLPSLGQSCPYGRCAEIGARCDAMLKCVPMGWGAACRSDADCSFYSQCDIENGICADVPMLGDVCVTRCAGPSWCDRNQTPARCEALLPNGTPCLTSDQCESFYCEPGEFFDTCRARPLCT